PGTARAPAAPAPAAAPPAGPPALLSPVLLFGFNPGPGSVRDAVGIPGGAAGVFSDVATAASGADPGAAFGPAPGNPPLALATASGSAGSGSAGSGGGRASENDPAGDDPQASSVSRTVREFVEVVPDSIKAALAALAALAAMLGLGYLLTALRSRRLARQRRELLEEVGLLQAALLPPVPERLGALKVSVAYRPADGLGAGGDFYDVLPLEGGRTGFVLGDVSGHGRDALAHTAFLRYTLRAYLEAGLEPRGALRLAGQVIEDLGGDFATVILAVHDPDDGSLTYSAAGHPPPVVVGPSRFDPVLAVSSPPVGTGLETGRRQTTLPLEPGAVVCLHTDGLTEARTEEGGIMGRGRLTDLLAGLGRDATAPQLLDVVAADAARTEDDMAACLLAPTAGVAAGGFRSEQLELSADDLEGGLAERFLQACGVAGSCVASTVEEARAEAGRAGAAILQVRFGTRGPQAEVLPANVESLEAAARRARSAVAS
ncbi:MAG: serine/threonine-protein phosphatase, partial [Actinomycetota bacterium]|nr:serine/threonine-protein phosphatase [Actinomycetota bacterium]